MLELFVVVGFLQYYTGSCIVSWIEQHTVTDLTRIRYLQALSHHLTYAYVCASPMDMGGAVTPVIVEGVCVQGAQGATQDTMMRG